MEHRIEQIDPHAKLSALVHRHSINGAAERLGISPAYVSHLMNQRRTFSSRVLAKLGLQRIIVAVEPTEDETPVELPATLPQSVAS